MQGLTCGVGSTFECELLVNTLMIYICFYPKKGKKNLIHLLFMKFMNASPSTSTYRYIQLVIFLHKVLLGYLKRCFKCCLNECALQTCKMPYFTLLNSLKHFLSKGRVCPLWLAPNKFVSASFFSSFWFTLFVIEPSNIVIKILKGLLHCACRSVRLEILIWLFIQLVRVHLIATLKSAFLLLTERKTILFCPSYPGSILLAFHTIGLPIGFLSLIYFFLLPLFL